MGADLPVLLVGGTTYTGCVAATKSFKAVQQSCEQLYLANPRETRPKCSTVPTKLASGGRARQLLARKPDTFGCAPVAAALSQLAHKHESLEGEPPMLGAFPPTPHPPHPTPHLLLHAAPGPMHVRRGRRQVVPGATSAPRRPPVFVPTAAATPTPMGAQPDRLLTVP